MIGQSFAPLGDPSQRQSEGPQPGVQEAIKILNLRMPRVQGASAPAPQALLEGAGSAGLPQQQTFNPAIQAILQAILGHLSPQSMSAPSAPGRMASQMGGPQMPTPAVHYQPLPGGTAGPNPFAGGPANPMERRTEGKQGLPGQSGYPAPF